MGKIALLTGITGQDGSYLTEFLLERGYQVHGIIRRSSSFNTERIDHLYEDPHGRSNKLFLHYGDLTEASSMRRIVSDVNPDEVYNLGAQSHVQVSFQQPEYTVDVVGLGTLRLLEAIREHREATGKDIRCYQAGSSEMYGLVQSVPQNESTPFHPRSPYSVAKVYAYWQAVNYRESYGMFISNGILFNHESPRRGETFVTRKITRAAARIKLGLQDKLYLGNLEAKRDWGFARDYVEAMWLMLQHDSPDDFVVSTGETRSVKEFLEVVFEKLDLDWQKYVEIDSRYFRPAEVDLLLGDSTKARQKLGWSPKTSFHELVNMMIEYDLELATREKILADNGYETAASLIGTI